MQQQAAPVGGGGDAGMDAFMTGFAGNMLRQQGQSYLHRTQAFMQSKMGFISGGLLHYHFSITPEYGERHELPLLLVSLPFIARFFHCPPCSLAKEQ